MSTVSENMHNVTKVWISEEELSIFEESVLPLNDRKLIKLSIEMDLAPWQTDRKNYVTKEITLFLDDKFEGILAKVEDKDEEDSYKNISPLKEKAAEIENLLNFQPAD
jgi:hypothetical protein